jgi:hypothetical protein
MSIGRNTIVACLAIAAVLIGHFAHWSLWAIVAIAVAIVGGAWILTTVTRRHPQVWPQNTTPPPLVVPDPPPPVYQKETVTDVRLPSGRTDYHFVFSATVLWLSAGAPEESSSAMKDLAINEIVRRASDLTRLCDPADSPLIRHELSRALLELRGDAAGRVQAMAESVQLALPEQDRQRLDKLAGIRKEEDVWEYERRREQSMRRYLSTDVLKDPGTAVVWWLARNNGQVETAVQSIDLLVQLSRAANSLNVTEPDGSSAAARGGGDVNGAEKSGKQATAPAEHFEAFMLSLGIAPDTEDHLLLTSQVANLVAKRGHQTVADDMTRRYDVQDDHETPADDTGSPGPHGALGGITLSGSDGAVVGEDAEG